MYRNVSGWTMVVIIVGSVIAGFALGMVVAEFTNWENWGK